MGQPFTVKVTLDPSGQTVNASDGTLSYDGSALSVTGISKDGSAFSLWTADPSFSNSAGTISYSGGTPSGFSKVGTILTITFNPKKTGATKITVSKGSVLAADGKGTDVYKNGGESDITITDAAPAPAVDPNADLSGNPPPPAPTLTSLTNPKSDNWYASSTATFNWVDTDDITNARVLLSSTPTTTPTQMLKGAATSTTQTNIQDGVWYMLVQLKNDGGWGDVASMKVQIDTTPPAPFDVSLQAPTTKGDVAKFAFKTDDALSGLDHYELLIGSSTDINILATDMPDGTYAVPPQEGGSQSVTVRAYDKAGNEQDVTKQLTLPKVDKPVVVDPNAAAPASTINYALIALIVAVFALGMLVAWNMYTKKGALADHAKLLKRVAEVGDKNDRVFSAMREEFEAMVNEMDEKPQLTPLERDFLERIKEVLDISEEIVDSGMEDLKKLVRG